MNVVREINKINERELESGTNASWHDEYKHSAYIFVGGLHFDLSEGDVITIFSQYGEIMDINMPRDKETGKARGFAFLMYEDQRSTVLAVDNLNGAQVLEKTLRVDHVKNYKQPNSKTEDGEWVEPEEQSMNARPELVEEDGNESDSSTSTTAGIDPDDPMRDYLIEKRREEKALKKGAKSKGKRKHKDETPEEKRARKQRRKEKKEKKKAKSAGMKGVEDLLKSLGVPDLDGQGSRDKHHRHSSDERERSRSPLRGSRSGGWRSKSPSEKYSHSKYSGDDDKTRGPRYHSRSRERTH